MSRLSVFLSVAGALAMLTGCTAHYRHALEKYRAAEPTPFYKKTQEWLNAHGGGAGTDNSGEIKALSTAPERLPEAGETTVRVAARVLGIPEEAVRIGFERTGDKERFTRDLAAGVEWKKLQFAIALFNPAVQSARAQWQAVLKQYSQADYLEGLLREYGTFTRYLKVAAGKPMQKGMTGEFFPYPGTISIKGELIREQAHLAELEWQRVLRDALVDAGTLFFDYQYQFRAEAATRVNISLLEDTVRVVESRYQAGAASQADLLKAQTELELQKNTLLDFVALQKSDAARILALLDLPSSRALGKPGEDDMPDKVPDVQAVLQEARAGRQEVNEARSKAAATEIAIRLGEIMNRPEFTQGYSTFARGMGAEASEGDSFPSYGLMAKTVTRPAYAQAEAYLAEMRERLTGQRAMVSQMEAQTEGLARNAVDRVDIARRALKLVREIVLPQDRTAQEVESSGYTAGNATFLDLIDAERALIAANLELVLNRRNLNVALLQLAMVRGLL